jgi:hypothetical protein
VTHPTVEGAGFGLVGPLDQLEEAGSGDQSDLAAGHQANINPIDVGPLTRVQLAVHGGVGHIEPRHLIASMPKNHG